MNNFAILHAIVTQLITVDWKWKCAYYTKISASHNIGKHTKLKNHLLPKAYHCVVFIPGYVSASCDVNSTWLLHDHNHDIEPHLQAFNPYNTCIMALLITYMYLQCIVFSFTPKYSVTGRLYRWRSFVNVVDFIKAFEIVRSSLVSSSWIDASTNSLSIKVIYTICRLETCSA